MATRVVVPELREELRDEVLTNLRRQRTDFERVWQERFDNLRRTLTVNDERGSAHIPTDDPFYQEFVARGEERLRQYDTAYTERLTLVQEYETDMRLVPSDNMTPELEEVHEMKTANQFLVGADPEFGAYKKGKPINVNSYVARQNDPFGYDHGGRVIELKPNPARSSFRVVRNLRNLLLNNETSKKLLKDGVRYQAGAIVRGTRDAIGGHVHLGIPYTSEAEFDPQHRNDAPMQPTEQVREVVRSLDRFAGILEALDILPAEESKIRRTTQAGGYGTFGEVRCANTHNHMEYRTMCSWMHSPIAAMVALTGSKLCGVDPDESYRLLGPTNTASVAKLLRFFEAFKESDIDAARVVEKILEGKQELLPAKPDANMIHTWRDLVPAIS